MFDARNKILLAMRSPILAPLYLAKLRGGPFTDIEFEYPSANTYTKKAGRLLDPIPNLVLSNDPSNPYIAAVADPFRVFRKESVVGQQDPLVLGGIIRHQTFWLMTDDEQLQNSTSAEFLEDCSHLISQPKVMAGYAVLADWVDRTCTTNKPREKLYHDTVPGWERQIYKRFCRRYPNSHYAFLTTNPFDGDQPLLAFFENDIKACEDYQDTLMTAIITGKNLFRSCLSGFGLLTKAIENEIHLIYTDPTKAAVDLIDYIEKYPMDQLCAVIPTAELHLLIDQLRTLADHKIYCPELIISRDQIERGHKLRSRVLEKDVKQEVSSLVEVEDMIKGIRPEVLRDTLPSPPDRVSGRQWIDGYLKVQVPRIHRYASISKHRDKERHILPTIAVIFGVLAFVMNLAEFKGGVPAALFSNFEIKNSIFHFERLSFNLAIIFFSLFLVIFTLKSLKKIKEKSRFIGLPIGLNLFLFFLFLTDTYVLNSSVTISEMLALALAVGVVINTLTNLEAIADIFYSKQNLLDNLRMKWKIYRTPIPNPLSEQQRP